MYGFFIKFKVPYKGFEALSVQYKPDGILRHYDFNGVFAGDIEVQRGMSLEDVTATLKSFYPNAEIQYLGNVSGIIGSSIGTAFMPLVLLAGGGLGLYFLLKYFNVFKTGRELLEKGEKIVKTGYKTAVAVKDTVVNLGDNLRDWNTEAMTSWDEPTGYLGTLKTFNMLFSPTQYPKRVMHTKSVNKDVYLRMPEFLAKFAKEYSKEYNKCVSKLAYSDDYKYTKIKVVLIDSLFRLYMVDINLFDALQTLPQIKKSGNEYRVNINKDYKSMKYEAINLWKVLEDANQDGDCTFNDSSWSKHNPDFDDVRKLLLDGIKNKTEFKTQEAISELLQKTENCLRISNIGNTTKLLFNGNHRTLLFYPATLNKDITTFDKNSELQINYLFAKLFKNYINRNQTNDDSNGIGMNTAEVIQYNYKLPAPQDRSLWADLGRKFAEQLNKDVVPYLFGDQGKTYTEIIIDVSKPHKTPDKVLTDMFNNPNMYQPMIKFIESSLKWIYKDLTKCADSLPNSEKSKLINPSKA